MANDLYAPIAPVILALLLSACSAPAPDIAKAERQSERAEVVQAPLSQRANTAPPVVEIVVDPACLLTVAWFEDRESADIRLSGCRPASGMSSPDEKGWLHHESADGQRVLIRDVGLDPTSGRLSFDVAYNGGGTLSGKYRVVGTPTGGNILKAGQFTITPLD